MTTPRYEVLEGWTQDISKCTQADELPPAALALIDRIGSFTGVQVKTISTGPNRAQTVELSR